ncbi:MAG: response regulator transcription factor [Eubacterium sp.]|nr:response regulator transcription factor [Eubacterium sp.]
MKKDIRKKILIVEDEEKLRTTVSDFLKLYDYDIIEARDGEEAVREFEEQMNEISLVLLDIMLPIYDGQFVLKKIREISEVPVIMMTAKSGDYEQIKSFGNGVDDYIKKPFMLAVLKARVEAVLKRTQKEEDNIEELVADKLRLDCKARKIYVDGNYIITTPKEFDLLKFFIQNQNVTLKREQILDAVWGADYDGTYRTVDTIIKQIRIKLGEECPYIKSIYGIGYIFEI